MKNTIAIFLILTASLTVFSQTKGEIAKRHEDTNKQLKPIEAYVELINAFVEKQTGPQIVIADVSDYNNSEKEAWVRFDSVEAYENDEGGSYTTAYVWKKDDKVVQLNFTYSSPSGDWAQYVFYTFYADGKVAKVDRELRTFMDDIIVNRVFYFDAKGKSVKESRSFRDLRTQELVKEPKSFEDIDVELYKKLADIPFASMLKAPEPLPAC